MVGCERTQLPLCCCVRADQMAAQLSKAGGVHPIFPLAQNPNSKGTNEIRARSETNLDWSNTNIISLRSWKKELNKSHLDDYNCYVLPCWWYVVRLRLGLIEESVLRLDHGLCSDFLIFFIIKSWIFFKHFKIFIYLLDKKFIHTYNCLWIIIKFYVKKYEPCNFCDKFF